MSKDGKDTDQGPVTRAEFNALRDEMAEVHGILEYISGTDLDVPRGRSKEDAIKSPLPPGTPVLLRAGEVEFPAIIISHRVVREGFAPRYRLFVIYANFTGFLSDKVEGDGDEQFRIR